jgi:FAD binding domain/Berberine and berberine like
MSTMSLAQDASRLSGGLTGEVVLPGQPGFDDARQAFNLAADQEPAAVVFAGSARDVAAAITFAADHGLRIAAQGTGHNAMPLGPLTDTILLKTHRMNRVDIDPLAQTARVEAGTVWSDVVQAAAKHGLAPLPGSSGNVGVAGYTLGGGVSFLGRKYGLSASNVRAIEVVTADGQPRRADREHEPDLFWALRGGGGSFGVVTALELRLFPVAQLYAGILWYPIERGPDVLHAWRDLTRGTVPDELTTLGRFLRLPPIPEVPAEIRGKSFALVEAFHLGDQAQADELLAPLRALRPVNDTIATITVPELLHVHMDPEQPAASLGDGLMLSRLPDQAIDALVSTAGRNAAFPLASVEVRHLGGELGRGRRDNGALASLQAPYLLYAAGITPTPDLAAPARAQIGAVEDALAPWMAPHMYLNFSETSRPRATLWTEPAYHRLRQIKARVDPDDVIRSNHPVPPAW